MAQPLDPSHSVPQDLMPHVHLLSSFRYPTIARPDLHEVAKWLMNAPQIARQGSPVYWAFLDKPADGQVYLMWQPLGRMGVQMGTDGYVWGGMEGIFKHDLQNGLIMEVYWHKAGFIPGERVCAHARRRFRLVPNPGHPSPPPCDPSLFIVHYGPAEQGDQIPAQMIQLDERTNFLLQQRSYFTRGGQLRKKEFMLSDRVNWPNLPELGREQQMGGPGMQQQQVRGVPQAMAYPPNQRGGQQQQQPQQPGGPGVAPPAKRARVGQGPQGQPIEAAFDDEDETYRGDFFDHLTPREISLARYQQNHEWMEEILSSAYRINQITPADLGLGLKGELASLTEGIFVAHSTGATDPAKQATEDSTKPYVGKLDEGLADKFRQRVQEHIENTKSEIEKMKEEHAKSLAEFKKGSILSEKEKELRTLTEGTGPEIWRVEGGSSEETGATKKSIPDVISEVEASFGKKLSPKPDVKRIQDGGYQPPAPEPELQQPQLQQPQNPQQQAIGSGIPTNNPSRQPSVAPSQGSAMMLGDTDLDMGNTAAGLLDQMYGTGFSSASNTPANNFPTPGGGQMSANQSNAATPAAAPTASATAPPQQQQQQQQPTGDIEMGGTADAQKQPSTEPDAGTGSGDWVVVPKEGGSSGGPTPGGATSKAATPAAPAAAGTPNVPGPSSKPVSTAATPAGYDQNDFSGLGDLDTAGDALDGFDTPRLEGDGGDFFGV